MDTERVKGIFLGSTLRIVGTVLLSIVLLVAIGFLLGIFGVPSVEAVENQFGDVNESTTVIETDLLVNNPNPMGLKLGGSTLEYSVLMNDVRMAEGSYSGLGVGSGNSTVNLTSYMDNEKIPGWWVSHVENGEYTSVEVDAAVHLSWLPVSVGAPDVQRDVSTDITAAFNTTETRPIDANQPLVSDPILYLNETSGRWGEVTAEETEVVMEFTLYNPKPYPITASKIGYDMTMNDVAIGEGSTESGVAIPPGETRTITATTSIRNQRLDEWWVSHLQRNQRTNLTIDFYAQFDLSSGDAGTFRIPLDTMTSHFETDIFGTKGQSEADGDDSGGNGTSGEGTSTPTDGDSTATATPTATDDGGLIDGTDTPTETSGGTATPTDTPTPTPTATETDDGGLL